MIQIQMGAYKKYRNKQEWTTIPTGTWGEYYYCGYGPVPVNLCRQILADGYDPKTPVTVFRGNKQVFTECELGVWAKGFPWSEEKNKDGQTERDNLDE